MRVLFVCMPHPTHWFPLVPLAWALRSAGHEVRVAGQPDLTDAVTGSGLTAVPVGDAEWYATDPWAPELLGELLAAGGSEHVQHFDFARADPAGWDWAGLLGLEKVMIGALFASFNTDPMIDDLVAFARSWGPDLVIWEPFTLAGAVVATVLGVPHARLVYGPDITLRARQEFLRLAARRDPADREDPTAEWLSAVLARHGARYDETVRTGHFTIDTTPPGTRLPLDRTTVGMRHVPYNGPAVVPDWLRVPPSRPRVCLTLGVSGEMDRSAASVGELLAGMADLDVEIVATLGAAHREQVGRLPANTRVVDFVPLHDLLPTCAAIVHHGGVGTRAAAETHGVPQLMIAYGWDTLVKARGTEELGAGLCLPAAEATVDAVRAAVLRLLTDPALRAGARALRDEATAQPTPADVVPVLEKMVLEHRVTAGGERR
ncbi:activator-dependent family glycosyltransferase [Micromonospora sp. WMMD1076]|uniref:activator-dependent family glycosyltransferase n=1 Tax=Micromonospora sp. WMMD1076 TaxID=3016103 RepID=UPI00249ACFE7|nr:activator-dependent family glycosyltransferase [Micromonospora sp. WMMD1076]WFF04546.1 activator-dependent family glycosyltransferase [Micromonospora sp. WMMD1076]